MIKDLIIASTKDLVRDLFYYGRKEDEELTVVNLALALESKEITREEIIEAFTESINKTKLVIFRSDDEIVRIQCMFDDEFIEN